RERLGAHTRACSRCGPASAVLAEPERQLAGLPLIPPPPYLVDVVPDVVGTHPRHGTPFEAPPLGQRHRLLGKPVVAALAVLLLVACVELAVVFATRADGQPSTVVLEAPQPAVVNSPASPYQTLFAPQPPLTNASPPPFSRLVPAVPTLVSALDFGPIDQHSRVLGRDNGQSVKYGDRSVWIFDDTQLHDPIGFLNNSGAVTTDLNAADGITVTSSNPFDLNTGKGPTELVTLSPAEAAFERIHGAPGHCAGSSDRYCGIRFAMWPGPVVADPARHRLLVFYHKLCRFGVGGMPCSGAYGQSIGSGVAALDMSTGAITRLTAELPRPIASPEGADPSMFFPPQDEFYSGALAIGDTAYVYGNCKVTCQLARVPMGQITDRAQWQFYAGRDATGAALWSSRPTAAVGTLVKGVAGNSVLYAPALHGFLNIYMPWATNTVMFQIGGSPYGPWSTPYPLTQTPAPAEKPNYAAFAHVEYAEQNGLVQYVTYYQPSSGKVNLLRITFQPG
ncbi:MAG TPA: hypothetical protein VJT31_36430, partial [Rugosimonospora sp.]|nr:hypothetical protein [Rugosimonospora sp.]